MPSRVLGMTAAGRTPSVMRDLARGFDISFTHHHIPTDASSGSPHSARSSRNRSSRSVGANSVARQLSCAAPQRAPRGQLDAENTPSTVEKRQQIQLPTAGSLFAATRWHSNMDDGQALAELLRRLAQRPAPGTWLRERVAMADSLMPPTAEDPTEFWQQYGQKARSGRAAADEASNASRGAAVGESHPGSAASNEGQAAA
jgi:hypothetical protein